LKKPSGIFYGWVILAVAFISIALGYTIRNTFSVFYPTIVEEFGWPRGNTALMFSIAILVYGLMAPVAGSLVDRFEPRLVLSIGACIMGAGAALCSLATTQWHFYVFYGLIAAMGLSIAGWTPLTAIAANWFVKKRGLVFSILSASFGASLVSAPIAQYLISSFGWRFTYALIGISSIAIIAPLCAFFIRRDPREKGLLPDNMPQPSSQPQGPPEPETKASSEGKWSNIDWTLPRALKTYQFWALFWTAFCLLGLAEQIAITHQVYFFKDAGYEPMRAATIYSVFGIAFVVGNLCGSLSDSLGREKVYIPSCLLGTAAVPLLFLIKDTSQPWMPFLFAASLGLGVGTAGPVFFATVADLFHGKHLGSIQGFVVLGFSLGGAISPWLAGFLHDRTGSYSVTFFVLMGSLIVSAALMGLVAPSRLK